MSVELSQINQVDYNNFHEHADIKNLVESFRVAITKQCQEEVPVIIENLKKEKVIVPEMYNGLAEKVDDLVKSVKTKGEMILADEDLAAPLTNSANKEIFTFFKDNAKKIQRLSGMMNDVPGLMSKMPAVMNEYSFEQMKPEEIASMISDYKEMGEAMKVQIMKTVVWPYLKSVFEEKEFAEKYGVEEACINKHGKCKTMTILKHGAGQKWMHYQKFNNFLFQKLNEKFPKLGASLKVEDIKSKIVTIKLNYFSF